MQSHWDSGSRMQGYNQQQQQQSAITPYSLATLLQANGKVNDAGGGGGGGGRGQGALAQDMPHNGYQHQHSQSQASSRTPSMSGPSLDSIKSYPPSAGYLSQTVHRSAVSYDQRLNGPDVANYRDLPPIGAQPQAHPNYTRADFGGSTTRNGESSNTHASRQPSISGPNHAETDGMEDSPSQTGVGDADGEQVDVGENGENEKKRKKRRVAAHTCEQCTKRKQKCNKVIPCQHCIARGIADQCSLYIPEWLTVPQPETPPEPARRKRRKTAGGSTSIVKIESPSAKPGDVDESRASAEQSGRSDESGAGGASALPSGGTFGAQGQRVTDRVDIDRTGDLGLNGMSATTSPPAHEELKVEPGPRSTDLRVGANVQEEETAFRAEMLTRMRRLEGLLAARAEVHPFGTPGSIQKGPSPFDGSASAQARLLSTFPGRGKFAAHSSSTPDIEGGPPISPVLRRLLRHAGIPPSRLTDLIADLPPYAFSKSLVDQFFTFVNPMRYPIHESSFRDAMDGVYQKKDIGGPDPENLKNLPLIFIILATSVMKAPEELAGPREERKLTSVRMYWSCRRAFLIAASIQPESLELVVTGLQLTVYLISIHDRRLTEAWSILGASVRTAQAIGCHRDGTKLGLDSFATEYRRRLWAHLYHADRHYSLILGRPPSMSETYHDVQEASNIDLEEISPLRPITSRPLTEPTSSTIIVLKTRFALITGQIAHHFQKLHQVATYSEVEALDAALLAFIDDLPPHFRIEGADESLDDKLPYLCRHRYSLATEILFIRIILHRPWLLRKFWNDKYALSRRACFEATKVDFRLRQNFRKRQPNMASQIQGQFREFNAAMIAGISAIIAPREPDAVEMRLILTSFLDRHPVDQQDNTPHASQKENAIIYTLYRRSIQVLENVGLDAAEHQPGSDPVALLLGLRGEDVTAPPLRVGPEPGDDSYYSQPEFGEEKSTAVMVRDIYATMLRKGMVDRPHRNSPDQGPNNSLPSDSRKASATATSVVGAQSLFTFPVEALRGTNLGQMAPPEVDEDPQHLFDNWLSSNSFLAGASNGMSSVGLGEGNFAPVGNAFPYFPGLEGVYAGPQQAAGPVTWNGNFIGTPSFVESTFPGPLSGNNMVPMLNHVSHTQFQPHFIDVSDGHRWQQ